MGKYSSDSGQTDLKGEINAELKISEIVTAQTFIIVPVSIGISIALLY